MWIDLINVRADMIRVHEIKPVHVWLLTGFVLMPHRSMWNHVWCNMTACSQPAIPAISPSFVSGQQATRDEPQAPQDDFDDPGILRML
jgi:hypothetical protein